MFKNVLFVLCTVLLASCGAELVEDNQPQVDAASKMEAELRKRMVEKEQKAKEALKKMAEEEAAKLEEATRPRLVFKGVSMGMDIVEARKVLDSHIASDKKYTTTSIESLEGKNLDTWEGIFPNDLRLSGKLKPNHKFFFVVGGENNKVNQFYGYARVVADESGKVYHLDYGVEFIDDLFKVEGVSTTNFIKQAVQSYRIPKVNLKFTEAQEFYYGAEIDNIDVRFYIIDGNETYKRISVEQYKSASF